MDKTAWDKAHYHLNIVTTKMNAIQEYIAQAEAKGEGSFTVVQNVTEEAQDHLSMAHGYIASLTKGDGRDMTTKTHKFLLTITNRRRLILLQDGENRERAYADALERIKENPGFLDGMGKKMDTVDLSKFLTPEEVERCYPHVRYPTTEQIQAILDTYGDNGHD